MTGKQKLTETTANRRFLSSKVRIGGLLIAAGLVATVATLLAFLGSLWWFFELFSHFRVQYAVGLLLVGGLLLAVSRRRRLGMFFLAVAGINGAVVAPLYFGGPSKVPSGERLRLMSMNVHTQLGDPEKVRREVTRVAPDILVLLEINQRWVGRLKWLDDAYPHSIVEPREDNFGIGLYAKRPLTDKQAIWLGSALVPTLTAQIDFDGQRLTLLATHPLPPTGRENAGLRNEQLGRLAEFAAKHRPVVLLGDLNTTPWSPHFRQLLRDGRLHNSAHGFGIQATWPRQSVLFRIPIDHCLHSPEMVTIERQVGGSVGSDHFPVVVDIASTEK